MTSFDDIYDAFLGKMTEDEWEAWTEEEMAVDFRNLLEAAIPWFKFPRVSLERTDEGFVADLKNEEIQILASFMKCEWLNRTILSWENIKPLYDERDFSPAKLLNEFRELLVKEETKARKLESLYYRSINGKPYRYDKWAEQK